MSYESSDNWIRGVRAKVQRHTQEAPPRSQGASRSHLQRVSLPTFSGKAEEWPEFRRYFLELATEERFSPAVMIAQLREHLSTKEAKALIAGKTDPADAWAALNSRYGDKELALVNVKYKLINLDTSKGKGYEKVEALLQGVNEACAILKAVEAETELFNDVSLVAQLVAKLPASGQERWHQDRTAPEFVMCQKALGVKFLAWL